MAPTALPWFVAAMGHRGAAITDRGYTSPAQPTHPCDGRPVATLVPVRHSARMQFLCKMPPRGLTTSRRVCVARMRIPAVASQSCEASGMRVCHDERIGCTHDGHARGDGSLYWRILRRRVEGEMPSVCAARVTLYVVASRTSRI